MSKVQRKHRGESFESLMRRFKRTIEKNNIIIEVKKREQFEKPSTAKKRAKELAVKKEQKRQEDQRPKLLYR